MQTCTKAGAKIGWFIPESKYAAETWREIVMLLGGAIKHQNASEHRIELINGAVIEVWTMKHNKDAGRSRQYDLVVVDEGGLLMGLKNWMDLVATPTLIDRKGRMLLLSTPNVIGPDFDDIFDMALSGEDKAWGAYTASTFDNPHLPVDELDRIRQIIKRLPEWIAKQEYWAIPAPQAGGFFNRHMIRQLIKNAPEPVRQGTLLVDGKGLDRFAQHDIDLIIRAGKRELVSWVDDETGPWTLWIDEPDPDQSICMGIDIGAGVGAANSVISAGDSVTRNKVAEFASPGITPERLAAAAAIAGLWFGGGRRRTARFHDANIYYPGAIIHFEINGPGEVFSREMMRLKYPNLVYEQDHPGDVSTKDPSKVGWRSSPQAKETLLSAYRAALETGRITNPSTAALSECLTFRYTKTGKLESVKEQVDPADEIARMPHGDRTIADALLWDCFIRNPSPVHIEIPPPTGSPASRIRRKRAQEGRRYSY
jgi:hypothetical protein